MVQRNEARLLIVCESEKQASDRVLYQDAESRAPPSSPSWFLSLSLFLSFPRSHPHPFSLFLSRSSTLLSLSFLRPFFPSTLSATWNVKEKQDTICASAFCMFLLWIRNKPSHCFVFSYIFFFFLFFLLGNFWLFFLIMNLSRLRLW